MADEDSGNPIMLERLSGRSTMRPLFGGKPSANKYCTVSKMTTNSVRQREKRENCLFPRRKTIIDMTIYKRPIALPRNTAITNDISNTVSKPKSDCQLERKKSKARPTSYIDSTKRLAKLCGDGTKSDCFKSNARMGQCLDSDGSRGYFSTICILHLLNTCTPAILQTTKIFAVII